MNSGIRDRLVICKFLQNFPQLRCKQLVSFLYFFIFFCGAATQRGSWPPHAWGFLDLTHNDTPQSVGLVWTSDQLDAETSTWQHTTLTRDRYPCHQPGSNPQPQQANGPWPSQITRRHRVLIPTGLYTKSVKVSYISRSHVAEIQTDRPQPDMSKLGLASLTCVQSWRKIWQLRKYSLILKEILLMHIDTFTDVWWVLLYCCYI